MTKRLTPRLFNKTMREIAESEKWDPEAKHSTADRLMVKWFREHGFDEAMDYFEEMEKWYA